MIDKLGEFKRDAFDKDCGPWVFRDRMAPLLSSTDELYRVYALRSRA